MTLLIEGGRVLLDGRPAWASVRSRTGASRGGRRPPAGAAARRPRAAGAARHRRPARRRVRAAVAAAARRRLPARLALRDTEAQLLANGITTAMHAVTLSWEPGLRAPERGGDARRAGGAAPGMLRHAGAHALGAAQPRALEMALADIEAGRVGLLSFQRPYASDRAQAGQAGDGREIQRAGGDEAWPSSARWRSAPSRNDPGVAAAAARLAAAARRHGLPIASHDDDSDREAASASAPSAPASASSRWRRRSGSRRGGGRRSGDGLPQRGARRLASRLGVGRAAGGAGVCTVLFSDYYYPAMLQAALPWRAARSDCAGLGADQRQPGRGGGLQGSRARSPRASGRT